MNVAKTDLPTGQERWAPVEGFGGRFEVSSFGRIRRTDGGVIRFWNGRCTISQTAQTPIPFFSDKRNRMMVNLCTHRRSVARTISQLVASAFLPNPLGSSYVTYKDGDPHNCRVDNLVWVPPKGAVKNRPASHVDPMDMPNEEWRPLEGFDEGYEVSNLGRIRRLGRTFVRSDGAVFSLSPIVLHCAPDRRGIRFTQITANGKRLRRPVFHLVADLFLEKPQGRPRLIHLNGNPSDDRAVNLAWEATQKARKIEEKKKARFFKASTGTVDSLIERWLPIAGYEGRFEVSDFGHIRSVGRESTTRDGIPMFVKSRLLRQTIRKGRHAIMFRKGENRSFHSVDRLVALAFVPNPTSARYVCHVDGDLENDRADNLAWTNYHRPHKPHKKWGRPRKRQRTVPRPAPTPIVVEDGKGNHAVFSSDYQIQQKLGIPLHYIEQALAGKESDIAGLRIRARGKQESSGILQSALNDPTPLSEWKTKDVPLIPSRRMVVATPTSGQPILLASPKEAEERTGVSLGKVYAALRGLNVETNGWSFRRATESDLRS